MMDNPVRISVKWKHSDGHIVEELAFFGRIEDGTLFYFCDYSEGKGFSMCGSWRLDKLLSVKRLGEAHNDKP